VFVIITLFVKAFGIRDQCIISTGQGADLTVNNYFQRDGSKKADGELVANNDGIDGAFRTKVCGF
jgi:hypothetical protein